MTLAAYHLALDAHAELGNNALLARQLGADLGERFDSVGFGATFGDPKPIDALAQLVRERTDRMPLVFPYGPDEVARIAICSGGAARLLDRAVAEGYDCFLTGEAAEPSKHAAKEAGIHFIAAGHYATETLGVSALAAHVAARYGIPWSFVPAPTGL
jgi:putative NIF3 family GTP cyclohydrolase 1 type 2